jgi:hypothetical protein
MGVMSLTFKRCSEVVKLNFFPGYFDEKIICIKNNFRKSLKIFHYNYYR